MDPNVKEFLDKIQKAAIVAALETAVANWDKLQLGFIVNRIALNEVKKLLEKFR